MTEAKRTVEEVMGLVRSICEFCDIAPIESALTAICEDRDQAVSLAIAKANTAELAHGVMLEYMKERDAALCDLGFERTVVADLREERDALALRVKMLEEAVISLRHPDQTCPFCGAWHQCISDCIVRTIQPIKETH